MRLWLISPAISAMLKLSTFLKGIKGMGQLHAQGLEAGGGEVGGPPLTAFLQRLPGLKVAESQQP